MILSRRVLVSAGDRVGGRVIGGGILMSVVRGVGDGQAWPAREIYASPVSTARGVWVSWGGLGECVALAILFDGLAHPVRHRRPIEVTRSVAEISTQQLVRSRVRTRWLRSVIRPRSGLWATNAEARSIGGARPLANGHGGPFHCKSLGTRGIMWIGSPCPLANGRSRVAGNLGVTRDLVGSMGALGSFGSPPEVVAWEQAGSLENGHGGPSYRESVETEGIEWLGALGRLDGVGPYCKSVGTKGNKWSGTPCPLAGGRSRVAGNLGVTRDLVRSTGALGSFGNPAEAGPLANGHGGPFYCRPLGTEGTRWGGTSCSIAEDLSLGIRNIDTTHFLVRSTGVLGSFGVSAQANPFRREAPGFLGLRRVGRGQATTGRALGWSKGPGFRDRSSEGSVLDLPGPRFVAMTTIVIRAGRRGESGSPGVGRILLR